MTEFNRRIEHIEVVRLFGRYDYTLELNDEDEDVDNATRLSVLYGDNGTGKTTILALIFHLISSEDGRGHKSHIATIPFQKFGVTFADGTRIVAERPSGTVIGGYDLKLYTGEQLDVSTQVDVDPNSGSVTPRSGSSEFADVLKIIESRCPEVFYLKDSRDLASDTIPEFDPRSDDIRMRSRMTGIGRVRRRPIEAEQLDISLDSSIDRARDWLKDESIVATSSGETDAGQNYADILRSVATSDSLDRLISSEEIRQIKSRLDDLSLTSSDFAQFGLGTTFESSDFFESITVANEKTLPMVVQVLNSIVDGQRARLNARRDVYEKIRTFVDITNEYLNHKNVSLHVRLGLTIHLADGTLTPDKLSSGEKHLLLLFLNVLISNERAPLFLIDEPELSLNIKWQRNIVDSLLTMSRKSNCQFLLATHSIAVVADHLDRVEKLESDE